MNKKMILNVPKGVDISKFAYVVVKAFEDGCYFFGVYNEKSYADKMAKYIKGTVIDTETELI